MWNYNYQDKKVLEDRDKLITQFSSLTTFIISRWKSTLSSIRLLIFDKFTTLALTFSK